MYVDVGLGEWLVVGDLKIPIVFQVDWKRDGWAGDLKEKDNCLIAWLQVLLNTIYSAKWVVAWLALIKL